ncbi:LacI family DNA-binding transcriptional regulator [Mangrovicoccus sp. HB161399]|uniref:LacI family DNA-binding transcriptional regulator n=1 Tax=Mangrovicoccus sp. HB161399 TaxID=2720392 RepID=UPI001556BC8A|nr:LacI family DNA-binding transcriptional regulator [Mangrovicoccus sp. HB161399]
MTKPTIADLAKAADVSVSTVNRILAGNVPVRGSTMQRVQSAAEKIGFYGIGTIEERLRKSVPSYRLGFLLQQSNRELYQIFGRHIVSACRERRDDVIEQEIRFVDVLTPDNIAAQLLDLAKSCDAVALIAADHPLIAQAIRTLGEQGKPVVTYITDQSARERAAYVGADNWKLGRTAAWLIANTTHEPGRVAVFNGNHRYQCQDVADASFRSYMREHAPHLTVEDSQPTHEEASEAYAMLKELLAKTDDLRGIFIVGGGISGVLAALREEPPETRHGIRLICRDIGPIVRNGLSEGLVTAALCHPLPQMSAQLVQAMVDALTQDVPGTTTQYTLPFEIVTPENL